MPEKKTMLTDLTWPGNSWVVTDDHDADADPDSEKLMLMFMPEKNLACQ